MRFRSLAAGHDWPLVDVIRRPLQAIQDTSNTRFAVPSSLLPECCMPCLKLHPTHHVAITVLVMLNFN